MRFIARWVVCVSVCMSIGVSYAKATEPIEKPVGGLTHVGPGNYYKIKSKFPRKAVFEEACSGQLQRTYA